MPDESAAPAWAERAAERSPLVQRSRVRSMRQARLIVDAARKLIVRQGEFTTQELVKEAGVALQTFYRYFGGKDQLLVAVIEDMIGEQAATMAADAADITDPIARLHSFVTSPLRLLGNAAALPGARSVTAEHWRLHQVLPAEMANASRPFVDLLRVALIEAQTAGQVDPTDPERDAWLIVELVRSVFHHYAFAPMDRSLDDIADYVWTFCLRSVGGSTPSRAMQEGPTEGKQP